MNFRMLCIAALAALVAVPLSVPASGQPSQAVPTKKPDAAERDARARAHVTVQKRTFLDAGVEGKPGQRKFTDYAFPPGYSPTSSIDFTSGNGPGPLSGPWDPTRNNFWPW